MDDVNEVPIAPEPMGSERCLFANEMKNEFAPSGPSTPGAEMDDANKIPIAPEPMNPEGSAPSPGFGDYLQEVDDDDDGGGVEGGDGNGGYANRGRAETPFF